MQEYDRKGEHQKRADYPIQNKRNSQYLYVFEYFGQLLVIHFCQRRVHHQDKADSQRDISRSFGHRIDIGAGRREKIPNANANGHCQEYP